MTTLLPGLVSRDTAKAASVGCELIVDNFAGAGGASLGIEAAMGRAVDIAINHSRLMLAMHEVNHPATRHLCEDVWDVEPLKACQGRPVGLAWFSPDCKHFSKAKGGKPLSKRIRGLAWVVIRWAKAVKPRVIILENVEEFATWGPLDNEGKPVKAKRGQTFLRWKSMLRNLGYQVEHRELVAADYGVPTTRKRFFLIARCDGQPIRWPARTHAPRHRLSKPRAVGERVQFRIGNSATFTGTVMEASPEGSYRIQRDGILEGLWTTVQAGELLPLLPWRSAAECIDWTLPCPSIFERKRPLADATLRRIARGVVKYVLNASEPFIVTCNHSGSGGLRSADEPMRTVTGSRDAHGVISPGVVSIANYNGRAPAGDGADPLSTVTAWPRGGHHALVEAFLTKYYGDNGEANGRAASPADPLRTADTQNRFGVVSATLMTNTTGHACTDLQQPCPTLTSGQHQAVIGASLIGCGGPVYSGKPASPTDPLGTVMTQNHRAVAAAHLTKLYGTSRAGADAASPMPTVTGGGLHIGEVRAFLVKYYGSGGQDQSCSKPMHTLTAKARMGLVSVRGEEYQLSDIGLRMLEPRELLRAQFGRHAQDYVLMGTKADQVAAIGNSVPPEMAEVIVRANFGVEA